MIILTNGPQASLGEYLLNSTRVKKIQSLIYEKDILQYSIFFYNNVHHVSCPRATQGRVTELAVRDNVYGDM